MSTVPSMMLIETGFEFLALLGRQDVHDVGESISDDATHLVRALHV